MDQSPGVTVDSWYQISPEKEVKIRPRRRRAFLDERNWEALASHLGALNCGRDFQSVMFLEKRFAEFLSTIRTIAGADEGKRHREDTVSETLQEKNKAFLIRGFEVLFNQRDFEAAERFWSPNYIQHSAHIEPGRDGLFTLVKSMAAGAQWEHGIIMAEGDYVMVHSRYTNPDRSALVVMDIMRIEGGVFQEHWDVMQAEASEAESKSKLPMFGNKFQR